MSQAHSTQFERILPHNHDAERLILGVLLLDGGGLFAEVSALLPIAPKAKPGDSFFFPSHRAIFAAYERILSRGQALDPLTVQTELRATGELDFVGGPAYLATLFDGVPRFSNVDQYVNLVKADALRRDVIMQAAVLQEMAFDAAEPVDAVVERAQRVGYELELPGCGDAWTAISELAPARFADVLAVAEANKPFVGTPTGFADLDYLTGGFEPGELIYVAGRPAMGKTSFAMCAALNAARHPANEGKAVAVFEQEMTKEQLMNRWYGQDAKVDVRRLRLGQLSTAEWRRLTAASEQFAQLHNLLVDDRPGLSPMQMRAKLRRLRQRLCLIVVDYLSLMRLPGASRAEESSEKIRCESLSRELKQIGKEFSAPVMAILPLNKVDGQNVRPPTLNDVSYVGGYEPDIVLMLHREEYYNPATERQNLADLIIGKNRNGPTGKVELVFLKESASFENYRSER